MPRFSQSSLKRLNECHPLLQLLFKEVIKHYDCKVICGYRSEKDQNNAYDNGFSKKRYAQSKHNIVPSQAIDVVPYPIDWRDLQRFYHFVGYCKGIADMHNIRIRSGLDWDEDLDFSDNTFIDAAHIEIML